jgi:hypothetical protein
MLKNLNYQSDYAFNGKDVFLRKSNRRDNQNVPFAIPTLINSTFWI